MAAHSSWGMSGQSRIIACPGSVRMQAGTPYETNEAAERGTAVHEATEFCLIWGLPMSITLGMTFNGFVIDEDMVWAGSIYVEYVNKILEQRPNATLFIERKVCISSIDENRLWGTSDCIIVDGDTLIVGDYKNGYGLVEVNPVQQVFSTSSETMGNAQCMGYVLGAMDTLDLWGKVNNVITFVVQPNADHADGSCRWKQYSMDEVNEWWHVFRSSHHASLEEDAPLNAGNHCRYCKARGFCKPRIQRSMELMGLEKSLYECDSDQLIAMMREADTIRSTLDAVYNQCVGIARKGKRVPGYKLVQAIKRAKCTDESGFIKEAVEKGYPVESLTRQKLKGRTDINKVVKDTELVDKYFVREEGGLTLVPMSDKRPAVMADNKPSAAGVFQPIED